MSLDTLLPKVAGMMVDVVKDKAAMILGVPKEIRKLQVTLETINCVLEDAERKRVESNVVENWLKDLKDVVYDADDIFDLWKIRQLEEEPSAAGEPSVRCHDFLSSACLPFMSFFRKIALSHDIGNKIKDLNLKLEKISEKRNTYGLVDLKLVPHHTGGAGQGTSHVLGLDIVGTKIEDDSEELVDLLTRKDTRANTGVLVLAIVGTGGIGKTTLAKKIFNDEKIKSEFELKIWVCVSQELNKMNLVRDIISGARDDHGREESMSILIPKLESAVAGKKFLLVLDDVWDENLWEDALRDPLNAGAVGSRVVVTSRKTSVTQRMKAIKTHNVELMSAEDGWSLLSKKVLLRNEEEWEIEGLKEVGLKIVEKCGRLPLAIKALGGVLCNKDRTSNAWESVLYSNSWSVDGLPEEINKALYISYLELSMELKRCFLFLSSFPEDHQLEMNCIVGMWIAEGLIKAQEEEYLLLEEVGQSHFKELMSKSLLLPYSVDRSIAVMHDLFRFFAQFLTRGESLHIEERNLQQNNIIVQHKLRHLSLSSSSGEAIRMSDILEKHNSLRTLMVFNFNSKIGLFSYLPLLRVLDLHNSIPCEQELSDILVGLIHLRYLDVSDTPITKLPDKLGNLKNLQFLLLHDCYSLDALPKSVVELPNLRRLSLPESEREGIPVPAGVGRLESLRCLEGFKVQFDNSGVWSSLEELQNLSHLTKLTLGGLERVLNRDAARAAAIGKKSQLKVLHLSCTSSWVYKATEEDMKRVEEVFEELQPPPSIETLWIRNYPALMPPSWMSLSAASSIFFPNLKTIELGGWKNCKRLPALGQLPNLTDLDIWAAESVESIGSEFMGTVSCSNRTSAGAERGHTSSSSSSSSSVLFPKLKKLLLSNMTKLKTWAWGQEVRALSSLQSLTILECGLEAIPQGLHFHATSLTDLELNVVGSLESITSLMKLKTLSVRYSYSLSEIFDFPSLETLNIWNCPSLRVVKNLPALQSLTLRGGNWSIGSLPDWLAEGEDTAKPSRVLEIEGCTLDLMKKLKEKGDEEWLKIQHINHVKIYAKNENIYAEDVYAIYTKTPYSFTTNIHDDMASSSSNSNSD